MKDDQSLIIDLKNIPNEKQDISSKPETCANRTLLNARKRKHFATKIAEMKMKLSKVNSPTNINQESSHETMELDNNSHLMQLVDLNSNDSTPQSSLILSTNSGSEANKLIKMQTYRCRPKSPVSSSTNTIEIIEQLDETASQTSEDFSEEKDDEIREFIFKDEEYVQMPKALFNEKLNRLKRKVACYENVIQNMRAVLDQAHIPSSFNN
ncbi:uncharacterized protein LOC128721795 [Anopheles nili]|uniref:uncharacterized protein LOC128721795 n=1 Tax=Anopheles nili TaxID=185578 RepID=UPI00237C3FC5|nr:uncharacterized protein LOC128721795 [Anopheles nili]